MEMDTQADYRCRVCLMITEHTLYLDETFPGIQETTLSYKDVLMLCCNIKVSVDDGKPNKICLVCMENAETAYEFKICCERSNFILENETQITSKLNSTKDIKHEDTYDSLGGDSLSDDTTDPTSVPNNIHAIDFINSEENTTFDTNSVGPIMKNVEKCTLELNGDKHLTVSNNNAIDSDDSLPSNVELSVTNSSPKLHDDNPITDSSNEVQNYICECGKSYVHDSSLQLHMKTCIFPDHTKFDFKQYNEQEQNNQANEAELENQKLLVTSDKSQKLHICKCGKSYKAWEFYRNHIRGCNGLRKKKKWLKVSLYKCNTCERKFNNFRTFSAHIRQKHTNVGKCSFCDTILTDYKSLVAHTKEQHPDEYFENICCDICGVHFAYQNRLRMHRETKHKILYRCKHCDFTSRYSEGFQGHMRDEHGVIDMVEDKDFSKSGHIKKCEFCSYTTTVPTKLGKHVQYEHEDKKRFHCNKCGAKFFTKKRLQVHGINQHRTGGNNKNCICEVCGTQFTPYYLKQHMKIHNGVRSYKCKFCPKAFVQPTSLNIHLQTHSEEKNLMCDICGKCFKTKPTLRGHHVRVHIRQLKVKCSFCDKAFLTKQCLNEHNVVHTRSRLFKCEVCKRGFGRRDHLKTHMRTHTGEKPHVCHVCEKGFSQAHCLRIHLLKHSNTKNKLNL